MTSRLPDKDLAFFENTIAVTLRMQGRVRRLVYLIDDPEILADLVGLAEDAARIRRNTIAERDRRRGTE